MGRWYEEGMSKREFFRNTGTVAFVVLRGDTLLYEYYDQKFEPTSRFNSFSVSKGYVSILTGIALAEGHILSLDQSIADYIPDLVDSSLCAVKIRNLLQMTSGIKTNKSFINPWGTTSRLYYGDQLFKLIGNLELERLPSTRWNYQNINTQLLGEIVVRATGRNLTDYLQEKIWTPLGMEHPASWSLDQRRNGREKAFCCLNATARDFAKFGRLYLHNGNWEGQQVVPEDWVKASTELNSEEGSYWGYGYQWWIPSKDGAYAAEGHLGQFIYVHPAHDLVIVRLGQNYGGVRWYPVFAQIAAQYP